MADDFNIDDIINGRQSISAPVIEGEDLITVSLSLPIPIINLLQAVADEADVLYGNRLGLEPSPETAILGIVARYLHFRRSEGWEPGCGWGPIVDG